jgi:methenyltetrahydrofolate cyclohydrolase
VQSSTIADYLDRLAAPHPTPASAAVAALNLAQAAGLLAMVARLRLEHDVDTIRRTGELREAALGLAEADAQAVETVVAAYALPRSTETERQRRATAIADALLAAAEPPARAVPLGAELIGLCERLAGIASGALLGDVAAAADATAAAVSISRTNVEADVAARRGDPEADRLAAAVEPVDALLDRAARVRDGVRDRFRTG